MASEYYKWLARDVKPVEHRELTKAEKRRNWWYYNKYFVLAGVVLLGIGVNLVCSYFGIGKTKPDYAIAYVGSRSLSDEGVQALQDAFSALGRDENGDGEIFVAVNQYVSHNTGDADAYYYAEAANVQLIGDITSCDSYFFLLEDPERFQLQMHILCHADGTLPADDDFSAEGMTVRMGELDVPEALPEELRELSLGRRGFWTEETTNHAQGCALLWDKLMDRSN